VFASVVFFPFEEVFYFPSQVLNVSHAPFEHEEEGCEEVFSTFFLPLYLLFPPLLETFPASSSPRRTRRALTVEGWTLSSLAMSSCFCFFSFSLGALLFPQPSFSTFAGKRRVIQAPRTVIAFLFSCPSNSPLFPLVEHVRIPSTSGDNEQ